MESIRLSEQEVFDLIGGEELLVPSGTLTLSGSGLQYATFVSRCNCEDGCRVCFLDSVSHGEIERDVGSLYWLGKSQAESWIDIWVKP